MFRLATLTAAAAIVAAFGFTGVAQAAAIKLFDSALSFTTFSPNTSPAEAFTFGTKELHLSCPGSLTATISRDEAGTLGIVVDNHLTINAPNDNSPSDGDGISPFGTVGDVGNVCGGAVAPGTSSALCFARFNGGGAGGDPLTQYNPVAVIDVAANITAGLTAGEGDFIFRLMDWGALAANSDIYLVTNCSELEPGLTKELTSGPNVDGDSETDVVVPLGEPATTPYDFTITYVPGEEEGALVVVTVPAEWDVIKIEDDDTGLPLACGASTSFDVNALDGTDVDVFRGGKSGKSCRSDTDIEWKPDPNEDVSTLLVDVTTRINPGHGKRQIEFYSPTSCGPLFLNDGAVAFELDAQMNLVLNPPVTGDPVVLPDGTTEALCLAAVDDPDGTSTGPGATRSATADHDTDTLASFAEACTNVPRSDPCLPDTDGDGVNDNVDNCPLIPNPGAGQTADGDSDGVGLACDANDGNDTIGVAQCADGIDNDGDGRIDHSSSALSDNGGDSQCTSATDNDESA